jgi:hypothetical protein
MPSSEGMKFLQPLHRFNPSADEESQSSSSYTARSSICSKSMLIHQSLPGPYLEDINPDIDSSHKPMGHNPKTYNYKLAFLLADRKLFPSVRKLLFPQTQSFKLFIQLRYMESVLLSSYYSYSRPHN